MIPSTTNVREVSRVEHDCQPENWCESWKTCWKNRQLRGYTERMLLSKLVKRIATCPDSEINEVRAAARYAVGE